MNKFDYEYYRESYCGVLDEVLFSRFAPTACDIISLLVGFDCTESGDAAILRALCLECDCLERQSHTVGLGRESLGDYSAEFSSDGICKSFGCHVSGEVIAALCRGGYLTRWA